MIPSLHVEYKRCHVKQYFKEGRALRTETTINDAYDFGLTRGLSNFDALRDSLASAPTPACWSSSRWPTTARLASPSSTDLVLPEPARPTASRRPASSSASRASTALLQALCLFALLPARDHQPPAPPPGRPAAGRPGRPVHRPPDGLRPPTPGPQRAPPTPGRQDLRYELTPYGRRVALFLTKLLLRLLRPGLHAPDPLLSLDPPPPVRLAFDQFDAALDAMLDAARLAA